MTKEQAETLIEVLEFMADRLAAINDTLKIAFPKPTDPLEGVGHE